MSSSTTGSNRLASVHTTEAGTELETHARRRAAKLRAAIVNTVGPRGANFVLGAERAEGYRLGRSSKSRRDRETDHSAAHMDIPEAFISALQHGPAAAPTSFPIGDIATIHMTVTAHGTGSPEPASRTVWNALTEVVLEVSAQPFCADVVAPLPREIAAVSWTTPGGTTTVKATDARRSSAT